MHPLRKFEYQPLSHSFAARSHLVQLLPVVLVFHSREAVKDKENKVYTIRNALNEAVVGIRTEMNGDLCECKGKNNKTVLPVYIPYVQDFFNHQKIKGGNDSDLEGLLIYSETKKLWGTFESLAEHVGDMDGLQLYHASNIWVGKSRKQSLSITVFGKDLSIKINNVLLPTVINVLNHLKIVARSVEINEKSNKELFCSNGKWGTFDEVSEVIGTVDGFQLRSTESFCKATKGKLFIGFDVTSDIGKSNRRIDDYSGNANIKASTLAAILNAFKVLPVWRMERYPLKCKGFVFYDEEKQQYIGFPDAKDYYIQAFGKYIKAKYDVVIWLESQKYDQDEDGNIDYDYSNEMPSEKEDTYKNISISKLVDVLDSVSINPDDGFRSEGDMDYYQPIESHYWAQITMTVDGKKIRANDDETLAFVLVIFDKQIKPLLPDDDE